MNSDTCYSPKTVATAIGVSESSLKRWCDQGKISSTRTAGGHRRLNRVSVLRFVRESQLRLANPEAIDFPIFDPGLIQEESLIVDTFTQALLSLNELAARRLLLSLYIQGWPVFKLLDAVVCKSFQEIGDGWKRGELDIYQERVACEITLKIFREIRNILPPPNQSARQAIGGTLSGDMYSIPTMMNELVFADNHWNARSLGTDLPFDSFVAAAENHQPQILWLSVSHIPDRERFLVGLNRLASELPAPTALLVGGRALCSEIRQHLKFTFYCDNMSQLNSLAHKLHL